MTTQQLYQQLFLYLKENKSCTPTEALDAPLCDGLFSDDVHYISLLWMSDVRPSTLLSSPLLETFTGNLWQATFLLSFGRKENALNFAYLAACCSGFRTAIATRGMVSSMNDPAHELGADRNILVAIEDCDELLPEKAILSDSREEAWHHLFQETKAFVSEKQYNQAIAMVARQENGEFDHLQIDWSIVESVKASFKNDAPLDEGILRNFATIMALHGGKQNPKKTLPQLATEN